MHTATFRPETRNTRDEALTVLEEYARALGLATARPNKVPDVPAQTLIHLVVARKAGLLAIRVRSGTVKGSESWASTTHTYFDIKKLQVICEKTHFVRAKILQVFVAKARQPGGRGSFQHRGCYYNVFAVEPHELLKHARPRAARSSWNGKFDVARCDMERIARPLSDWLIEMPDAPRPAP